MKLSVVLALLTALSATDARRGKPGKPPADSGLQGSVLNLSFGNGDNIPLADTTADDIIGNISSLNPPPWAVIPLVYNSNLSSANPDLNPQFIQVMKWLNKNNIPFYPAVGNLTGGRAGASINTTQFAQTVTAYRKYTDCIQISGANTLYYPNDPQEFVDTMYWLNHTLGFKHINLNQWPKYGTHGGIVDFSDTPAVDSVYFATGGAPNYTVNLNYLDKYYAIPNMHIILNYENPSTQAPLASLSRADQIDAFQSTISSIQSSQYAKNNTLLFAMPWTRSYNPFLQGTWGWYQKNWVTMTGRGSD